MDCKQPVKCACGCGEDIPHNATPGWQINGNGVVPLIKGHNIPAHLRKPSGLRMEEEPREASR